MKRAEANGRADKYWFFRLRRETGRVLLAAVVATSTLATPSVIHAGANAAVAGAVESPVDATTLELAGLEARFESIAKKVSPSVVAISVAIEARGDDDTVRSDDMTGRKLTQLLEKTTRTVGTGFIISSDGLILTNEHVVSESEQIWCTTDDGRVLPAYVVGSDPRQDLAVLKICGSGLIPVALAAPESVRRGQWAIALGNPYGLANEGALAMAVGVVSATGRALPRLSSKENRLYSNLIQTTAEINPGNSGGPLFDLQGRVFGINTAVVLPQKNTNGIGFALPLTEAILAKVETLKQGMEVSYGELGVSVSQASVRQRKTSGVTGDVGIRVDEIEMNGPCGAILRNGDVLVALNDTPLRDVDQFARLGSTLSSEVPVKLTLVRGGKTFAANVMPRRRPMPATPVCAANQRFRWKGMVLGPIPGHWAFGSGMRPESGLMVLATDPNAIGALPTGTVIQYLAGHPLRSISDLQNALSVVSPEASAVTCWAGTPITEPKTLSTAGSAEASIGR